ncbi:MAG: PTS fructose transporter subunit IIABC [Ancrocorticia sp.]|uniref:PTS fructose transporter subunit IIABC n=2 Tax=Ancrocorticia sp. TaxID=2593684 RepID=UPI003F93804C
MSDMITAELVRLGVEPPGDKLATIGMMADVIASTGRAEKDGLEAAMLDRESKFATGMPGGIAIPHCRSEAVNEASLGFLRLATPVDFGAKDGPADIVIGIAAPDESGSAHMKLLAQLSRALVRPGVVDSLRAAGTAEEVAELVMGVVSPPAQKPAGGDAASASGASASAGGATAEEAAAGGETGSAEAATTGADSDKPVLLASTSCPTGIAHTYMAAESLENAAKDKGIELITETQGSGGIEPFKAADIARAGAIIIAADVGISGRDRFAGMPLIESGVKRPMTGDEAGKMIDEAVAAVKDPNAKRVAGTGGGSAASSEDESGVGWGKRIQQALMTGVSYMIPFVAAGGLMMALGFLLGGYDVSFVASDVVSNYSITNLPDQISYVQNDAQMLTERSGMLLYLGAVCSYLGSVGMGFLVAALSGYIAFGLAGRPGIAPGFIGGAVAVFVDAGFLGGLVTGIFAGLIALWFTKLKPPRWLAGLMPVVIIPLITSLVVGALMLILLGRPLASLMSGLQNGLTGMADSGLGVLLGILLGLMMCFDMGGPFNKAAYLFATAGLSAGVLGSNETPFEIMAAVMAAGMVPPLAMALSTTVRRNLYTAAERENGTTAWLLGAAFISEGAIPFAAADPLRVIPSMMAGGAVTGAITMALHVGSQAPHGGLFVFFAIQNLFGFVLAVVAGTLVAAAIVTLLKSRAKAKQDKEAVAA